MIAAEVAVSAICARLKTTLTTGRRRTRPQTMPVPTSAPSTNASPLANTSPKTNGRSARENECALRRKRTWTTQISAHANPSATAHQGSCGSACACVPCVKNAHPAPATTANASTYTHVATSRVGMWRRRSVVVFSLSIDSVDRLNQRLLDRAGVRWVDGTARTHGPHGTHHAGGVDAGRSGRGSGRADRAAGRAGRRLLRGRHPRRGARGADHDPAAGRRPRDPAPPD